jgi:hypothetical protein
MGLTLLEQSLPDVGTGFTDGRAVFLDEVNVLELRVHVFEARSDPTIECDDVFGHIPAPPGAPLELLP